MEKSIVWGTQVNADLFDPDFATQLPIDPARLPPSNASIMSLKLRFLR